MTIEGIAACHRVLRAIWLTEPITEDTIRAWQWAFEDYGDEQVAAAVRLHIKRSKWFPKPADLIELIAEAAAGAELLPEVAWREVVREIGRLGRLRGHERQFSDPLIAAAVDAVGWNLLCTTEIDEARKQFIFTMRPLQERAKRRLRDGSAGLALGGGLAAVPERVA